MRAWVYRAMPCTSAPLPAAATTIARRSAADRRWSPAFPPTAARCTSHCGRAWTVPGPVAITPSWLPADPIAHSDVKVSAALLYLERRPVDLAECFIPEHR